ncbi:MAG: DUF2461 domain-containing protein [Holophagales bacterium]|nr:DUF2461 domain-containing protein [Holophagales bacterium]
MPEPSFTPALFDFFRELNENNDREWFQAHKKRYEHDVKDACLRFITEVGPGLRQISAHVQAIPKVQGGSMFRIHRDVRFSKDKSPYKTHAGLHFRHAHGKDAHAPGYYLHLEPDQVFVATGMWHPPTPALRAARQAMMDDPEAWRSTRDDAGLNRHFHFAGESLKRAPKGVDPDHPLIEDLKRKDLIVVCELEEGDALAPTFRDRFLERCREAEPLPAFLCKALDAPW